MSATRCFSCIAFPFPRVVLGSKNIQVAKIFGPAKPLLSRVSDRQPVQQTLVVPQRQCLRLASCRAFSSSVLTCYIEGQCRLLYYCNTHFKNLASRKLGDGLPLFTSCREGVFSETGFPVYGISRKLNPCYYSFLKTLYIAESYT